uniref:pyrroloquinoline quinone-dependent dehydrogenase n=1 Tax=Daejeonella sp. TaxID=2805397 RepID=UPI004049F483
MNKANMLLKNKLVKKIRLGLFLFFILLYAGCQTAKQQFRTWSTYKADANSSSFSPLKQVNKLNVTDLELAWTFPYQDAPPGAKTSRSEANPIVIDGVMFISSARNRIYGINASNGKQIWSFDPFNGGLGGGYSRGVTYWEDGNDKRILFTAGNHLFAVDARSGKLILSFGQNGKVNLNFGMRGDPDKIFVAPTSPGIIYKDLLILGTSVSELYGAEPGYQRAYNVKTGKLVWTFHTIPHPGEFGYDTWPKDAWKYSGGVNDWSGMSLDEKRGMVFLALGSPSYDFYGGDRKGQNLFGNSVVALDAQTGKYIWHFQTIHHDLWDYDLSAPPNLVSVVHDGKKIDAVAQTSKIGFIYLLNRETGEPLFPIEERPVPASDVPGEEAWPTQPFPLKPEPYARQHISLDDLSNFSKESNDELLKRFKSIRYEGLFTPPSLRGNVNLPGTSGGSNWGGGAFDQASGIIYVRATNTPGVSLMKKMESENESGTPFTRGKALYATYCQACHGIDKNGDADYPSLAGLKSRMTEEEVLIKIRGGGGRMPSFANIIAGKEEAIISFLFNNDSQSAREINFMKEIAKSQSANKDADKFKLSTPVWYLDILSNGKFRDLKGRYGIKPPWTTLNAINLNTGDYEWSIPLGNYPHLQEKGEPETGSEGNTGPIVTAGGLVFIGANMGANNFKFRAYDKDTGKLLWDTQIPANTTSNASTYLSGKKQYIAVSVAGDLTNPAGYIMVYALFDKKN